MLKSLTPYIAKFISSDFLLLTRRRFYGLLSQLNRLKPGQNQLQSIDVFIKLDDPYSYLLLQILSGFQQRYGINLEFYLLTELPPEMYPDKNQWDENAFKDCIELAQLYQLQFPDKPPHISSTNYQQFEEQLLSLSSSSEFNQHAQTIYTNYWFGQRSSAVVAKNFPQLSPQHILKKKAFNYQKLIHHKGYLSASIYYAGEWYWGLDRLYHLENRLKPNKAKALSPTDFFQSTQDHQIPKKMAQQFPPLTMYFSIRSPYSYLGLEKAILIAQKYQLNLQIKVVLPMLMRGLKVPKNKQWYIFKDTKREARANNIDYGFVADPLGKGVENCYAILEYAKQENQVISYLQSFARAVNAEGIRSDTIHGLKKIIDRTELSWPQAKAALNNENWRQSVEKNRQELAELGLWGVPCFHFNGEVFWGQDRLWVIEKRIIQFINEST